MGRTENALTLTNNELQTIMESVDGENNARKGK